jgi:hypothetical protein
VFFADEEALKRFTADRAKYDLPANFQLVATGQAVQVACPVLGKKLASRQFQVRGVAVCCGGCQGKLSAASPQQFADTCFGANFEKVFQVRAATR